MILFFERINIKHYIKSCSIAVIILMIAMMFLVACAGLGGIISQDDKNDNDSSTEDNELQSGNKNETNREESNDETQESGAGLDDGYGAGDGGAGFISFVIEIKEDVVYFNNVEISIEELEDIIIENHYRDEIWELHDSRQAVKAIYDEVVELLKKYDVVFREN